MAVCGGARGCAAVQGHSHGLCRLGVVPVYVSVWLYVWPCVAVWWCAVVRGGARRCAVVRGGVGPLTWVVSAQRDAPVGGRERIRCGTLPSPLQTPAPPHTRPPATSH